MKTKASTANQDGSPPSVSSDLLADFEVIHAMNKYGGGFVCALARAAAYADDENLRRIKAAWPEYWAQYMEMAKSANDDSASDYDPATCLREEVARFKLTNRFTPMDVTGFYIQAAVVLDEHRRMLDALRAIKLTALTTTDGARGLAHIVRLCLDAGIRLKLDELRTPNMKAEGRREERCPTETKT